MWDIVLFLYSKEFWIGICVLCGLVLLFFIIATPGDIQRHQEEREIREDRIRKIREGEYE